MRRSARCRGGDHGDRYQHRRGLDELLHPCPFFPSAAPSTGSSHWHYTLGFRFELFLEFEVEEVATKIYRFRFRTAFAASFCELADGIGFEDHLAGNREVALELLHFIGARR